MEASEGSSEGSSPDQDAEKAKAEAEAKAKAEAEAKAKDKEEADKVELPSCWLVVGAFHLMALHKLVTMPFIC